MVSYNGVEDFSTEDLSQKWKKLSKDEAIQVVENIKEAILRLILDPSTDEDEIPKNQELCDELNRLKSLYYVNKTHHRISHTCFYISALTEKKLDAVRYEYLLKREQQEQDWNICDYRFILDMKCKIILFRMETYLACNKSTSGDLHISVSREFIIRDTLSAINRLHPSQLKLPLKISFKNEEAADAGGVRKEFFLVLMEEVLNLNFGMFKLYETPNKNYLWFSTYNLEELDRYFLIGALCGLAIHNNSIVDLPFPVALYKKLLDQPVTLEDYTELKPESGRHFEEMLISDVNKNDVNQYLRFDVSETGIDNYITDYELIKGGYDIEVTNENKEEYVNLNVDWLFNNEKVAPAFDKFKEGFFIVCSEEVLQLLFTPQELMNLVVGKANYNWKKLQEKCQYRDGCQNEEVVKMFWEVFYALDEALKKDFLKFLTGSDRISVLGFDAMEIEVVKFLDQFPTAHTCLNLLHLPRYPDKETFRDRLEKTIKYGHNKFGML